MATPRLLTVLFSVCVALALACGGPSTRPPAPTEPAQLDQLPPFPLVEGAKWTWDITRVSPGVAIFFIPTGKVRKPIATWTMTLGAPDGQGRFPATLRVVPTDGEGEPKQAELTLWEQDGQTFMDRGHGPQPALTIERPPWPVSSERTPCVLHVLDGVTGMCSPAPGGADNAVPLVEYGLIEQGRHPATEFTNVAVMALTAMMVIPGSGDTKVVATLSEYTEPGRAAEAPELALVTRYEEASGAPAERFDDALGFEPWNRDELAALVRHIDRTDHVIEVLPRAMAWVAPPERYSLVRAALARKATNTAQAQVVARMLPELPAKHEAAQVEALVAAAKDDAQDAVRCLLERTCPYVRDVLVHPDTEWAYPEKAISAVSGKPDRDEAVTLVRLDRSRDVIEAVLARAPESQRGAWVLAMIPEATNQPDRRGLLESYQKDVLAQPEADRRAVLADLIAKREGERLLGL